MLRVHSATFQGVRAAPVASHDGNVVHAYMVDPALFVVHGVLAAACCVLHATRSMLHVAYAACCMLRAACCPLHACCDQQFAEACSALEHEQYALHVGVRPSRFGTPADLGRNVS